MRTIAFLITLFISVGWLGAADSPPSDLARYDADGDQRLSEDELVKLFLETEGLSDSAENLLKAQDFAEDALSFRCISCNDISFQDVNDFIAEIERVDAAKRKLSRDKERKIGWRGLGFSRSVVDTVSPRPSKFKAPLVFSYRHDSEADEDEDGDQLNILGALQVWKKSWDFDEDGASSLTFTPGIDLDLVGSKAASETTISIGLPVFFQWVFGSRQIESLTLAASPKFSTDRDFDREVLELGVSLAVTSPIAGAGFISPRPVTDAEGRLPPVGFFWEPSIGFEIGDVQDAAGNEKLEVIAELGTYKRVVPRVKVILFPYRLSERLRITGEYFYRIDLDENWERPYGELRVDYDLTIDGAFEFSMVYRKGRKPPAFEEIKDFLVGFGIRQ